jgi:hypothetical protein
MMIGYIVHKITHFAPNNQPYFTRPYLESPIPLRELVVFC